LRDLRATAVIATAIPISLLAAFVPLRALDVSLNLMSLGGLALGVGMLVDNSIVALESIARVREEKNDLSAHESAVQGTAEIADSVVASTLTTVAVFLPMTFVEGVAGQLIRDLAYAVSFSILSSMFVSLTIVPVLQGIGAVEDAPTGAVRKRSVIALAYRLVAALVGIVSRIANVLVTPLVFAYTAIERTYPPILSIALRLRAVVLLGALALCLVSGLLVSGLGRTLVPEVEQGEFHVQLMLPQGTSLEATTALARHVMVGFEDDPRVETSFARVGSLSQSGSATGTLTGPHLAQIDIRLDPAAANEDPDLANELFADVRVATARSGAELRMGHPALFSFEAPIEIRVFADETATAIAHARSLVEPLRELEVLDDIVADDLDGRPEVRVAFDRERLGRLGLEVEVVSSAVQRAIQGEVAGQLHAADKQLDIRVRLPRVDRSRRDDVARIPVAVVDQVPILLSAVAEVEPSRGPAEVRRIDGRRGLRIQARPRTVDLAAVGADVSAVVDEADAHAPANVETLVAGQVAEMSASLTSIAFTTALSLFLVYVVMASSFESLHHPFIIMFTVPLAGVGVVLACFITGIPISAMVGIGAIVLGGIVVNNAIVLVNAVNHLRGQGTKVREALLVAGRTRLRPIVMTTATTVLGLLPMSLGYGEGAALRQPLAVAVIGGLLVSTLLTLVVIPCAYAIVPGRERDAWR
jgi:HAE1 family hydrophobic/amphiphilic exporter-1